MNADQCRRLLSLPASVKSGASSGDPSLVEEILNTARKGIFVGLEQKNASYFEDELDKLDRWREDQRSSLKLALKELEEQVKSELGARGVRPGVRRRRAQGVDGQGDARVAHVGRD